MGESTKNIKDKYHAYCCLTKILNFFFKSLWSPLSPTIRYVVQYIRNLDIRYSTRVNRPSITLIQIFVQSNDNNDFKVDSPNVLSSLRMYLCCQTVAVNVKSPILTSLVRVSCYWLRIRNKTILIIVTSSELMDNQKHVSDC